MEAKLVIANGKVLESEIVLDFLPLMLGRSEAADIRINDRWVSRVNCEINLVENRLMVRDLDSRNGTLVNGQHISEAPLKSGDRLTIGTSTFVVSFLGRMPKLSATASTLQQHDSILVQDAGATMLGKRKHPR